MNAQSPNIEFQLSPTVKIGQIPALRGMEDSMAPERLYRLHYPSGISGELMTRKSGELEGLKTTSVMGEGGIVGVAGLEPVDITVTRATALDVLNLWQFGLLAGRINQLAGKIARIEKFIYLQSKAELDNIFVSLRDISRSVPNGLGDSQYKTFLFTQLAAVKRDVGQHFHLQLQFFDQYVAQECGKMNERNRDFLIRDFEKLSAQPVFKALELVAVVALFEIVIDGRFSSDMLNAAKEHLKDRSDQIWPHVTRYAEEVGRALSWQRHESQQRLLTHDDHQSAHQNWNVIYGRSDECHKQITANPRPLDGVLLPDLDDSSVKNLCVSSMNGKLQISNGS